MGYKVLDLFCGAGGMSLGFKLAGFDIIGGVEFDKDAMNTHKLNFGDGTHFCGDITQVTDEQVNEFKGKVDVVIGGPPCQGFSTANKWQEDSEKEEKNRLFFEFIRFVRILKPKVFLMENVRGILTKNNGFVKEHMLKVMDELGYDVNVRVLSANDFGVPQKRMRAFFVGFRKDLERTFDFDKMIKLDKVTVGEAISDLEFLEEEYKSSTVEDVFSFDILPKSDYQALMRLNSNNMIRNHNIKYSNAKVQERMSYVPEGGNWSSVPEELWDTVRNNRHSSAYRRLNSNEASITIDTGHMNYFHYKFNRVPTVRESARLQSFPDDFIFTGNQGAQFRQVGNAVPTLLSKAIASLILEYLNGEVK